MENTLNPRHFNMLTELTDWSAI